VRKGADAELIRIQQLALHESSGYTPPGITPAVRRFAQEFQPIGRLAAAKRPAVLLIRPDLARNPWYVRVVPAHCATVCRLG
jgi:hypothetical protein